MSKKQTLRNRMFLYSILAGFTLFFLILISFMYFTHENYVQMEQDLVIEQSRLISLLMEQQLTGLEVMLRDWAVWDDSYAFINDPKEEFIIRNMGDDVFENLQLNGIVFIHENRSIVYAKYYDFKKEHKEVLLDAQASARLQDFITTDWIMNDAFKGLIKIENEFILVAIHKIYDSKEEYTNEGLLLFARYFNEDEFKVLESNLNANIEFVSTSTSVMLLYDDVKELKNGIYYRTQSLDYIYGLVELYDDDGFLLGHFTIQIKRTLYQGAIDFLLNFIFFSFISALFVIFGFYYVVEKSVLKKIDAFDKGVLDIIKTNDISKKIDIDADKEIFDLITSFNLLTSSLEKNKKELLAKNERLHQANKHLQELDKLKDNFVSNISHELRTPLTSLQSYAQLLRDGFLGELTDEQQEAIGVILSSSDQLLQLITSLLNIARYENGKEPPVLTACDFNVLVQDIVVEFKANIHTLGGEIFTSYDRNIGVVLVDTYKLKQVLRNLIGNAIKYRSKNPIQIHITTTSKNNTFTCSIEDNGIGIKDASIRQIFDKFFQVDQSMRREITGTGLGLTITKHIIDAHGGTIFVTSKVGRGSIFTFTLPKEPTNKTSYFKQKIHQKKKIHFKKKQIV